MSIIERDERRGYSRILAGLDIRVNNRSRFPGSESRTCELENLSFTGARILSSQSLGEEGDTVELAFSVDSSETIVIKDDIVRADGTGEQHLSAIAFRRMGLSDQLRLHRALKFFGQARAKPSPITAPVSPFKKTYRDS